MNYVGDLMILRMRECGSFSVLSRDGLMTEVGTDLDLPLLRNQSDHPINYADAAVRYLRRDSRFIKTRVLGHNYRGHECVLSCFTLRPEFRK